MTNVQIRAAINSFTQVLATHVVRDARVQVNPNANATTLRNKDFPRMNPPTFFGSKVEEDPQGSLMKCSNVKFTPLRATSCQIR